MDELAAHRRAEASCPRGDPSLKEGISDAQWASLDAQSRKTNKSQESHRTEKWTEIWIVLFPGKDVPTPCKYADQLNGSSLQYSSRVREYYSRDVLESLCLSLATNRGLRQLVHGIRGPRCPRPSIRDRAYENNITRDFGSDDT